MRFQNYFKKVKNLSLSFHKSTIDGSATIVKNYFTLYDPSMIDKVVSDDPYQNIYANGKKLGKGYVIKLFKKYYVITMRQRSVDVYQYFKNGELVMVNEGIPQTYFGLREPDFGGGLTPIIYSVDDMFVRYILDNDSKIEATNKLILYKNDEYLVLKEVYTSIVEVYHIGTGRNLLKGGSVFGTVEYINDTVDSIQIGMDSEVIAVIYKKPPICAETIYVDYQDDNVTISNNKLLFRTMPDVRFRVPKRAYDWYLIEYKTSKTSVLYYWVYNRRTKRIVPIINRKYIDELLKFKLHFDGDMDFWLVFEKSLSECFYKVYTLETLKQDINRYELEEMAVK